MVNKYLNKITYLVGNKHSKELSHRNILKSKVGFFGFNPIKINTFNNIKRIKRKNLTWNQASIRYPKLKAFGDADHDGKLNMFDCRPFDKRKDGDFMTPPDQLDNGEILDPYYDEYTEAIENRNRQQSIPKKIVPPLPAMKVLTAQEVRKLIPRPKKWSQPGVFNEADYQENDNAIDDYVGSGSGSAVPVRGFQPGSGGGNKYG